MKFRKGVNRDLEHRLIMFIELAESLAGMEFEITSGRRKKGDSAHAAGLAVDISCLTNYDRCIILKALIGAGFRRIGIYDRHIHADRSLMRTDNVIWLGVSK